MLAKTRADTLAEIEQRIAELKKSHPDDIHHWQIERLEAEREWLLSHAPLGNICSSP